MALPKAAWSLPKTGCPSPMGHPLMTQVSVPPVSYTHLDVYKRQEYTPNWKSWSLSSLPMIPPRFGIKLIGHDPGIEMQFHVCLLYTSNRLR